MFGNLPYYHISLPGSSNQAAGVNPVDWKIREGAFQQIIQLQFLSTWGIDFLELSNRLGKGSLVQTLNREMRCMDRLVLLTGSGAFAEMALAKTEGISNKPKRLNHTEAAALPLVGVSAWRALTENSGLSKGQRILIHGGAGGIGSIAIQLAKYVGAEIAITVSANDKQFVQELGADVVIGYKSQNKTCCMIMIQFLIL
jgi:alcohol dehydrogenase